VIPEADEVSPAKGSPEDRLDCDRAGVGTAASAAANANTGSITRRIIVTTGFLLDWPTRRPAAPFRPANETCDSEFHLDDRIISPRFDIAHLIGTPFEASALSRRIAALIAIFSE
jgi:hypothetical protein